MRGYRVYYTPAPAPAGRLTFSQAGLLLPWPACCPASPTACRVLAFTAVATAPSPTIQVKAQREAGTRPGWVRYAPPSGREPGGLEGQSLGPMKAHICTHMH